MVDQDFLARLRAAYRACDRTLSGSRPQNMAERLAQLAGAGYDLDSPQDTYGNAMVADLESRVAGLLGKPAAAFFPSGTMAQQVALRIWAERKANPTVALHPLHHQEMHEEKAYSTLSGLRATWPTRDPRQPTADEIRSISEPYSAILIELPLREAGFLLPTWDELVGMCAAARERDAHVHFDGARLWESTAHLSQDLPTIAALADSVYVSFYKTVGGLAGAALAGDEDFIASARTWRHRYGGQMFSQWPLALSAMIGLDTELPRLGEYVAHAKVVAEALAGLPGVTVNPNPPHTHQFQLWLPASAQACNAVCLAMAEEEKVRTFGLFAEQPPGDRSVTEVMVAAPALDLTAAEVVDIGRRFLDRLALA